MPARHGARRKPAATRRETTVARLTRELNEITEQQKATADVLRMISNSSGDLEQVFTTILANAVRVSGADNGVVNRWDGEALHLIATHNMPPAFTEIRLRSPYRPDQHSASARMLATRGVIHIPDLAKHRSYTERNPPTVAAVEAAGVRTTLAIPMMKDGQFIGSFTVGRKKIRPFTDRQIEVVTSFANQAVIAVENARLLHELRETLQQQVAASDVLKIISRSTFDLQQVLDTLVELVSRLCDADLAAMHRLQPNNERTIAIYGGAPSHREDADSVAFAPGRGSVIARSIAERKPIHVVDVLAEPDYELKEQQQKLGYRTVLGVPLLREGEPIGVIVLMRLNVRPFTDKQIEVVQSFASQAIIAIENTRLFNELSERTDDLSRSVGELQRERSNKLMNLEAMVASISHEVRQPLASIASNGGAALRFLKHEPPNLDEARSALNSMVQGSHRASKVFDNIRALFGKADQDHEPIKLHKLAAGVLQTLRNELDERGIATRISLKSDLPPVTGHEGQLQEVLINLVRNAIEAMDGTERDRRSLQVKAERHGESAVALYIEDSGSGIDPRQIDSIFDAFMTTKTHGMGLGLAICRMIIERHAGQISASPAHPHGSIFRVLLPIAQTADHERTVREPALRH